MGVYEDYDRDYHAPDREEVLGGIKKYGTDDRSKWNDAPAPPPPTQPTNQAGYTNPNQQAPPNISGFQPQQGGNPGKLGDDQDYNGMTRDQFRDQVSGSNWANQAEMDQWMAAHGATKAGANGTFKDQWGRIVDMGIGYKSGGPIKGAWTATGLDGGGGSGGGGWGAPGPPGAPPPGNPGGPPPPGASGDLYNLLIARAKQGTQIDPNDPNIRQQTEPFAAAQEKQRRDYLADLAESQGPTVNLRGEQRLASERAGQATGQMKAQLIGKEISDRRAEIQNALTMWSDRLSTDQQQALQRELGYLDDATKRYGIDQQTGLGYGQLDLGRSQLGANIGRDEMDFWLRSQGM